MKKDRQIDRRQLGRFLDTKRQIDIGSMRYVNIEREIDIRQKDNPN